MHARSPGKLSRHSLARAASTIIPTPEGPFTSDIAVAETGSALKDEMQFTLDSADCWQFKVRLEAVNPEPCRLRRIEVIESTGKAPEQYPNADF